VPGHTIKVQLVTTNQGVRIRQFQSAGEPCMGGGGRCHDSTTC